MSSTTWTPTAVSSEAHPWADAVWRMVESQHVASTMKLVDSDAEQAVLESLLEQSKPAVPPDAVRLDYLLATPFRYDTPRPGSRFRGAADPGVFYGAESVRTAAAELGYWRWKFLHDAADLDRLGPVAHTAFRAEVKTSAIDLRGAPFDAQAASWTHPADYSATQALARIAREAGLGAIVYRSVRDPHPACCIAVLTPAAFAGPRPHPATQTWWLAVHGEGVVWRRNHVSMSFSATPWGDA